MLSIPASRYFYRRRGAAAALAYPVVFWAAVLLAALAASRGHLTWPSLAAVLACALAAAGHSVYLIARRGDLRGPGEPPGEAGPALRRCPSCGLEVDSKMARCPACGAGRDGAKAG